ncbi:tetratricopeptide repeat protein [Streptomyces sp. WMMC1477]|uniref:tetratricopeptide repeat protein n=1 Tax=Streptomyces sp. WMMC1477 TaxID=3015155 RepID=UPI0022B5F837|nr:tetratricopeptide repeat protein [Streptomyces sp. WMMC1477]MCZ7432891.1 tetratricopeptide repeat protein [Streptomyces sp. WMMC1477]
MSGALSGRASGQGRVYQAAGDQHIVEHHHHHPAGPGPMPDSVRVPTVGRTPPVLRDRNEVRAALREAVAPGGSGVHVLFGMGGCGKTNIAHALFREAEREGARDCFWVGCADRMTLRSSMLAVAAELGVPEGTIAAAAEGRRPAADLAWAALEGASRPWLLVLDNADAPEILAEGGWLRAARRGTVVVTTRLGTSPVWAGAVRHAVGALPLPDAAQALCDLAPEAGGPTEAREMARRLGCLPLALNLAGTYLAQQVLERWTMSEYCGRLEPDPTALLDRGARPGAPDGQLVGGTWRLSLDALAAEGLPGAVTLLRLLACWAAEPLPLPLLAAAAGHPVTAGVRVEPALRGLLDHSLVALTTAPGAGSAEPARCVLAHGVLLDSVAAGTPHGERARLLTTAAELLDGALLAGAGSDGERATTRLLAPHAAALLKRATAHAESAEPPDGAAGRAADEPCVTAAAEVVRKVLGPVLRVARLAYRAGDWPAALALADAAARTAGRVLGERDAVTLEAGLAAGPVLLRLGRYAEGAERLGRVRAGCVDVFGPDDVRTLDAGFELQRLLHRLGRWAEARPLLEAVLAGRARLLGPEHTDTLKARCELLELRAAQGDHAGAETAAAELVGACERYLGAGHLVTVWARDAYAKELLRQGRAEAAAGLLRSVLAGQRAGYGEGHPLVLGVSIVLSRALYASGETAEAAALAREVAEGRAAILGEDHPETAAALAWLDRAANGGVSEAG